MVCGIEMARVYEFKHRCDLIAEVVVERAENIVKVDYVLYSMVRSVEDWYEKNYQDDAWHTARKARIFHLVRA